MERCYHTTSEEADPYLLTAVGILHIKRSSKINLCMCEPWSLSNLSDSNGGSGGTQ